MTKNGALRELKGARLHLAATDLKQPLHARVRQMLREQILNDFEQDERFYSERVLVEKLGISQPTVRRALTDLSSEGYLVPAPRRGFFVRHRTEVRCTGLARTLCSYIDLEDDPIYFTLCRDLGLTFETYDLHKGDKVEDLLGAIRSKPTEERLLLTGFTMDSTLQLSTFLRQRGYRHLVVGPHIPNLACSSLSIDHHAEVRVILDHLVGLGHRRIAFILNEPPVLLSTCQRADSVHRVLAEMGLPESRLHPCDTPNWGDSFEAAYAKTAELLQGKNPPTALVPLSGMGCLAIMRYAYEHKIRIPAEISVLSFDEMRYSHRLPVPMTELAFSREERARRALEILWSESGEMTHEKIVPHLVARASSGPAPRVKTR
jgi:LacI family transcriptional regulator